MPVSRRSFLFGGLGAAATAGAGVVLTETLPGPAAAVMPHRARRVVPRRASAGLVGSLIRDLTGPAQTGSFGAPWTDLGIPVRCPDGSLLFVCGDTFDGPTQGSGRWTSPVGLRSRSADLDRVVIDGAIGGATIRGLVPEGHTHVGSGFTTAIPSDVFVVGDTMYLHLMRGVIFDTDHSELWTSNDNGETWTSACRWAGDAHGGQFQQKTFAVADDGYCYVLSSVFDRMASSGLLLHRVRHAHVGTPSAYEPWGYADGAWAWGNAPTTISPTDTWGELCFRVIEGRFVFTWFDPASGGIQAHVLSSPTDNLFTATKQQLIYACDPESQSGRKVANNYGGFIFPGSTLSRLDIAVSQWFDNIDYRVMQYRIIGVVH